MTALQPRGSDKHHSRIWSFQCDCGTTVTWRVSTVKSNAKAGLPGGGCCPACYRAAVVEYYGGNHQLPN